MFLTRKKILVFVFVFLMILYSSDTVMFEIPSSLSNRIEARTGINFFELFTPYLSTLHRFVDEIRFWQFKKDLSSGELPVYNLLFSENDLAHFKKISSIAVADSRLTADMNTWRDAALELGTENYKVKVKLHGDTPIHWSGDFRSYSVKSVEPSVNGMRRFSFIIPDERGIDGEIGSFIAKSLGLPSPKNDIVTVKINGVLQGVYVLQEKVDPVFLERHQCSDCIIVRNSDNWVLDHPTAETQHGVFWNTAHNTAFNYQISNIALHADSPAAKTVLGETYDLFSHVRNRNSYALGDYFDESQLSSYWAFYVLAGNSHAVAGDNFHMAYSLTTGKFYPLPIIETFSSLQLTRGSFEHDIVWFGSKPVGLFYTLTKNEVLFQARNRKLYSYITENKDALLNHARLLKERYLPFFTAQRTKTHSSREWNWKLNSNIKWLEQNMQLIVDNLEYAKVYLNILEVGRTVTFEVIPDSISALQIDDLILNLEYPYE